MILDNQMLFEEVNTKSEHVFAYHFSVDYAVLFVQLGWLYSWLIDNLFNLNNTVSLIV